MENYSIVLFILFVLITLSAFAEKIKLPYPLLLTGVGIAVGFIPSLPEIELNPEVIFLIFLPPLLYDAAFNISFKSFKANLNTISTLAFVLGSVLAATDAVAAALPKD